LWATTHLLNEGSEMSEVRKVNWEEVGEAFWEEYQKTSKPLFGGRIVDWSGLSESRKEAIIAGCKAAVTLAVEES
jgi:hypothetical protein